jgi:hypothetical protein
MSECYEWWSDCIKKGFEQHLAAEAIAFREIERLTARIAELEAALEKIASMDDMLNEAQMDLVVIANEALAANEYKGWKISYASGRWFATRHGVRMCNSTETQEKPKRTRRWE